MELFILLFVCLVYIVFLIKKQAIIDDWYKKYKLAEKELFTYMMRDMQRDFIVLGAPSKNVIDFEDEDSNIDQALLTERGKWLVRKHDYAYLKYLEALGRISDDNNDFFLEIYERAMIYGGNISLLYTVARKSGKQYYQFDSYRFMEKLLAHHNKDTLEQPLRKEIP